MCAKGTYAQHYQFSQFYAAPTYLNPAFTGANACARLSLNYRRQWSGIPGAFTSNLMCFDHHVERIKSGFGLQVFKDVAGLGNLQTQQVNFLYAYELRINTKLMSRAGLSVGSVSRRVNMGAFTFGDQIARGANTSLESSNSEKVNYLDLGFGYLVYSQFAWGGLAVSHLNQPNQSLMGLTSRLPAEIKLHGGYKFLISGSTSSNKKVLATDYLIVAGNLHRQRKFNQLDVGVQYSKNSVVLGCWYRGIPLYRPTGKFSSHDAMIVLFGIQIDKFKFGYSYDITISKLTNTVSKGSHELSMAIQFCTLKKPVKSKKAPLISCPRF